MSIDDVLGKNADSAAVLRHTTRARLRRLAQKIEVVVEEQAKATTPPNTPPSSTVQPDEDQPAEDDASD